MRSDKTLREEAKIEEWMKRHTKGFSVEFRMPRGDFTATWSVAIWDMAMFAVLCYGFSKLAALREAKRMIEAEERNK